MNIINNACQNIQDKGNLWIKTVKDGDDVRISIRNDGPPIPPQIIGKIFEPFFTTKDIGEGYGLGLSICYGIIDSHHGQIEVKSDHDQGTEFTITLPVKQSKRGDDYYGTNKL